MNMSNLGCQEQSESMKDAHVNSPDLESPPQSAQSEEFPVVDLAPLYIPLKGSQLATEQDVTYVPRNNQYVSECDLQVGTEPPIFLLQSEEEWEPITNADAATTSSSTYMAIPSQLVLLAVDDLGQQIWLNPSELSTTIICTNGVELPAATQPAEQAADADENTDPNIGAAVTACACRQKRAKETSAEPAGKPQRKRLHYTPIKPPVERPTASMPGLSSTRGGMSPLEILLNNFEKSMFEQPAHHEWKLPISDRTTYSARPAIPVGRTSNVSDSANGTSTRFHQQCKMLTRHYPIRISAGIVRSRSSNKYKSKRSNTCSLDKAEQFARARAAAKAIAQADAEAAAQAGIAARAKIATKAKTLVGETAAEPAAGVTVEMDKIEAKPNMSELQYEEEDDEQEPTPDNSI